MHSSLAFSRTDRRDTLLCLHCSASSGRQWDRLAEALAARLRRARARPARLRQRKAAGKAAPSRSPTKPMPLIALLDARDAAVHVLGHSYGGAVALEVAMRRPDLVKSLTVFEPVRLALLRGRQRCRR